MFFYYLVFTFYIFDLKIGTFGKRYYPTLLAQTHVLSKIGLHLDYIYHLKALVAENPKISSTKSSKKCQEIITKHFFFCPSS